jgi:hypothetical protein
MEPEDEILLMSYRLKIDYFADITTDLFIREVFFFNKSVYCALSQSIFLLFPLYLK